MQVLSVVPDVLETLHEIKGHYRQKLTGNISDSVKSRIRLRIAHIKMAEEKVTLEAAKPLVNWRCPNPLCKRDFTEEEIAKGDFYYCPKCAQALTDCLDPQDFE